MKFWSLIYMQDLLEIIVENTNKYILLKQYNLTYKTARTINVTELKVHLGLV